MPVPFGIGNPCPRRVDLEKIPAGYWSTNSSPAEVGWMPPITDALAVPENASHPNSIMSRVRIARHSLCRIIENAMNPCSIEGEAESQGA